MQVYLNGQFQAAENARVSIFDGGFLFGDGVYTTLRLYNGHPVALEAHWHRLSGHARALQLPVDLSLDSLRTIIAELVDLNGLKETDGRLRMTFSRGGSPTNPLLLTGLDLQRTTSLITLSPVDPEIAVWQEKGISAVVLEPQFARAHFPELKTLNGLPTVLALRQAARHQCHEAILTDHDGHLLEGSISNIFLVKKNELWTPEPRGHFLPGLTREKILVLADAAGITIHQTSLSRQELASADEVFCASSVREILPVINIDQKPVGKGRPGPVTRTIQAAYREAIKRSLA